MHTSLKVLTTAAVLAGGLLAGTPVAAEPPDRHGRHPASDHGWGPRADGLAETVREATRRLHLPMMAEAAGYARFLGCVSGPEEGAMGVHYANADLVGDDTVEAAFPEVLVYEPRRSGGLRLAAVEYLVLAEAWDASHDAPPVLEGQLFHYTGSPNRYGLPPFYALHVWAWKHNPHGTFVDWNPLVSCDGYTGEES